MVVLSTPSNEVSDTAGGVLLWVVIMANLAHPLNALVPTEVTELGMITDLRLVQEVKVESSMFNRESGIVIEVKPLHPLKAL